MYDILYKILFVLLNPFFFFLVPPRKLSYDPLQRSRKLFGGFIQDIKHRYPFYKSDVLDGLNFQCVASVIFIYFAAVSGAIAFGGLLCEQIIIVY